MVFAMVKKLIKLLYDVKADKWLHLICGLIIAQIAFALLSLDLRLPQWGTAILALWTSACAGGAKELIDHCFNGVPSWADFWFTLSGGAIGVGLAMLILI